MRKVSNLFFRCDFLTIYDGGSNISPIMGKYCSDSIPPSHMSSSKEIMVHFETDSYNGNEIGFKMEYNPTGKQNTSIKNNSHIWPIRWPFFPLFRYGKLLELDSICNSLNNMEGMTTSGRNDTNTEGMTLIWKE